MIVHLKDKTRLPIETNRTFNWQFHNLIVGQHVVNKMYRQKLIRDQISETKYKVARMREVVL